MGRKSSAFAMNGATVQPSYKEAGPVRYHPMHDCLSLILRLLTLGATIAAIVAMLKSTQTVPTLLGPHTARWKDFPAFEWFVIGNSIVLVYAALGTLAACLSLFTRRGPLSYTKTAWLTFLCDFICSCALISAGSTALGVAWIGKHGQHSAFWNAVCSTVDRFCDYVQGALIATLCGFIFQALSTVIAASALHNLATHRH